MAKFISSTTNKVQIKVKGEHNNIPINIELCIGFQKIEFDNGYGAKYPIIKFAFSNFNIDWVYNAEKDRNSDFDWLLREYS